MGIINISVIIPHRNSPELLKKLLGTIPVSDDIEVIVIDNSPNPLKKEQVQSSRDYLLLYSDINKGAGAARNVGMKKAQGEWLIFADSDDYFAPNAFGIVKDYISSSSDIVYFSVDGVYIDSGEHSDRAERYSRNVKEYLSGNIDENAVKYDWFVPWGKMIRREMVVSNDLKYDEIVASNDLFFSIVTGYYARSIQVDPRLLYYVTVNQGSLTRRRDVRVIESRLYASLHTNQFLKKHHLGKYQIPVMKYLYQSKEFGLKTTWRFIKEVVKYKQNPFVGISQGMKKYQNYKKLEKKESQYIVK